MFWSLFGRGEPTVVMLEPFGHKFTETVGYWIFGFFNISMVIVLLNMLIAMMSRSFEIIQVCPLQIQKKHALSYDMMSLFFKIKQTNSQ